eukprot:m.133521 g.133521  ORF g.133521 m.133521 type:complete len:108 (-) comp17544_c0_seq6:50-373(-)
MYPDLVPVLGWSERNLPCGAMVAVLDDTSVDGSLLLHHFIGLFCRAKVDVVMCGFVHKEAHYLQISKKLGTPLGENFKYWPPLSSSCVAVAFRGKAHDYLRIDQQSS